MSDVVPWFILNVQTVGVEQFENRKLNLLAAPPVGGSSVHPGNVDVSSPHVVDGLGGETP